MVFGSRRCSEWSDRACQKGVSPGVSPGVAVLCPTVRVSVPLRTAERPGFGGTRGKLFLEEKKPNNLNLVNIMRNVAVASENLMKLN